MMSAENTTMLGAAVEWRLDGWFYERAGVIWGPTPTDNLQNLLTAGELEPCDAVWAKHEQGLLFIQAAKAVRRPVKISAT